MTEPQVWVLMGIFATAVFGMLGWQTTSFNRNLIIVRDSLRESIESQGKVIDARFEALDSRIDRLERKVDDLDQDVQAISRRVFGTDPH
ncbi:MAG: hypothetical protein KF742_00335 [Cryobacterium sp.]|nr:hypothetical protein [Cryobacterium sp.]